MVLCGQGCFGVCGFIDFLPRVMSTGTTAHSLTHPVDEYYIDSIANTEKRRAVATRAHVRYTLVAATRPPTEAMTETEKPCQLCNPTDAVLENDLAYVRYDDNSLSRGHVLVIPRRHVANFFDMTTAEKHAVLALLGSAKHFIDRQHAPDGYNIGANIGQAGGQTRMHVHVHLIPRYQGDVPEPRGGVRCVLAGKCRT
jgi:diadenosine tetraphosphate (Ap4A) HIT family hydrolase